MAANIYDWSTTAASNASSDSGINWAEGQAPSSVNNSARQMMGRLAELLDDIGGTLTAGGTANALTITANSGFTTYATGHMLAFKAAADNTGATTLSVNAIGAKHIRKFTPSGESALEAGDIKNNGLFVVRYDAAANSAAGAWILQNPLTVAGLSSLTLTSTDAGAGLGPSIILYRDSASPASSDIIGGLRFQGEDSAGNTEEYGRLSVVIADPTSASEDAFLLFQAALAGTLTSSVRITGDAIAPNSSDGTALGTTALQWSDAYLAAGGALDWNNGGVRIIGSNLGSNTLTYSASAGHSFTGTVDFDTAVQTGTFSSTGATNGKQFADSTFVLASSRNTTAASNHQQFHNPNGQVGSISTSGTATSFNTSSDGRRKKNLRDFDSGGFLDALEVWLFDWISGGTGYGVIAQDAQKVFPDAITEDESGWLMADYSKFVPLLLREVKALRARVAALEAR